MSTDDQISQLTKRVEALEAEVARLKNQQVGAAQPVARPVSKPLARIKKPKVKTPRQWSPDLEYLLGGNIFGKLGLVTIILAVGWFIKLAFDNHWVNESGRIMVGLVIGHGMAIAGLWLAKKKLKWLPPALIGAGATCWFIAIYGGYYFYDLFSGGEAFLYLFLCSVFTAVLSYLGRNQVLYVFSLAGALLAPIMMSTGENSFRFLFTYLTVINVGFYLISRRIAWQTAPYLVLTGNFIIFSGWFEANAGQSTFLFPFIYLTVLFVSLTWRELFDVVKQSSKLRPSSVVLLSLNVLFYLFAGGSLVDYYYKNFNAHFFLVLAASLLVFHRLFLAQASLEKQTRRTMPAVLLVGLIISVFAALSAEAENRWLTLSYVGLAGSLSVIGASERSKVTIIASLIFWAVALLRLFFEAHGDNALFLLNPDFGLYLVATLLLGATYYIQRKQPLFKGLVAFAYAALFVLIVGSLVEVHQLDAGKHWRNLYYSYTLAFYGTIFLVLGFMRISSTLRITGMVLVALLIAKLYLYDIWTLSRLIRIIAGFTLGAGLVLLSIFYQKFKEKVLSMDSKT